MEGYLIRRDFMKPLGMKVSAPTPEGFTLKTVPANLHDVAEEVYGDKLYSLYTVLNSVIDNNVRVSIIATDLVRHTAGNGVKGYWVGVGIDSRLLDGAKTYLSWETIDDEKLHEMETTEPDSEQEVDGITYKTFYFNAASATDHGNTAMIVVDRDNVHYHFLLDFTQVNMKVSEDLEDVNWNYVSVHDVKNNYLFGIDLSDANGNPLPEGLYIHYINAAVDYLQNLLDITITETEFTEKHDYIREDYRQWGFIQLCHNPVKEVKALHLMYGNRPSVEIPLDWIQLNKLTGQITLFPSAGSANTLIIGQTGMLFGFQSQWDYAPMLWEVEYVAGIDENDPTMPFALLKEAVSKRASMGILNVWGDLIIGAGIASQSVSIDGLSQSIGTTQSAMFGGASARVQEYAKDIDERILPILRQKFGGIRMVVV